MHLIDPELIKRPARVLVVGCGGTGSEIARGLPMLHLAMTTLGHPGGLQVTLMDGDLISASNCVRQPFGRNEIGLSKAVILASRINIFYGLCFNAIPVHLDNQKFSQDPDIVIGSVDSRQGRARIHEMVTRRDSRVRYWLDLGNSASSGQVVLGQPLNAANTRSTTRLPTAAELFPEIIDTDVHDDEPSCSAAEAIDRQEPFVNQTLASAALGMLGRLFRHGRIPHHGLFANFETGFMSPLPADPNTWPRIKQQNRKTKGRTPPKAA